MKKSNKKMTILVLYKCCQKHWFPLQINNMHSSGFVDFLHRGLFTGGQQTALLHQLYSRVS